MSFVGTVVDDFGLEMEMMLMGEVQERKKERSYEQTMW